MPVEPTACTSRILRTSPRGLGWLAGGSRRRWLAGSWVLCLLLPWFFSCPLFPPHRESQDYWRGYWTGIVERKIEDPIYDYSRSYPPESHEAKRTFRVLVPLVARVTGTGMAGVELFRHAMHAVFILALLLAAERACGDRLTALGVSLAVAGSAVGTSVWRDACYWFDNCAHAFIVLALLTRRPVAACGLIILGGFVDERVFLALPLVALYHLATGSDRSVLLGLGAAVPVFAVLRMALATAFDLGMPLAGIGPNTILLANLPNMPAAFWFGLEGGWLFVGLACWRLGPSALGVALAGCTLGAMMASGLVGDFSRSTTYAFPATLVAAACLTSRFAGSTGDVWRRLAAVAAAVSVLIPNAVVLGNTVAFESSLPVRALLAWLRSQS